MFKRSHVASARGHGRPEEPAGRFNVLSNGKPVERAGYEVAPLHHALNGVATLKLWRQREYPTVEMAIRITPHSVDRLGSATIINNLLFGVI